MSQRCPNSGKQIQLNLDVKNPPSWISKKIYIIKNRDKIILYSDKNIRGVLSLPLKWVRVMPRCIINSHAKVKVNK